MKLKDDYIGMLKSLGLDKKYISYFEYGNEKLMTTFNSLKEIASNNGNKIHDDVYVGVYPDNIFNAMVTKRRNGILILISFGMFAASFQASNVLAEIHPLRIGTRKIASSIDIVAAKNIISDIIIKFINADQIREFDQFLPSDERTDLAKIFYDCLINFIIAHEMSHIICNHLEKPTTKFYGYKNSIINYNISSWEDEIEADYQAMQILEGKFDVKDPNERLVLGPVIFFELERLRRHLITKLDEKIEDPLYSSHPLPKKRLASIINVTLDKLKASNLPISSLIVSAFNYFRDIKSTSPKLKKLKQYALAENSRELAVSLIGPESKGIPFINYNKIKEIIGKNITDARKIIAFTATWYALSEEIDKEIPGSYLGQFTIVYLDVYKNDTEFVKILYDEIPNLDVLINENIVYLQF